MADFRLNLRTASRPTRPSASFSDDDDKKRAALAAVHRRGPEKLGERLVAKGSLEAMVRWIMKEEPRSRRNFIIAKDSLEYHPAEIENLARQFGIAARPGS